jgi:hypothetical protein
VGEELLGRNQCSLPGRLPFNIAVTCHSNQPVATCGMNHLQTLSSCYIVYISGVLFGWSDRMAQHLTARYLLSLLKARIDGPSRLLVWLQTICTVTELCKTYLHILNSVIGIFIADLLTFNWYWLYMHSIY